MSGPQYISVSGDAGTQKLLVADRWHHRVVGFTSEPALDTTKATLFLGQTSGTS